MPAKTVLIMRATGAQGRGAIQHLSQHGWQVHALVTDITSDRALALKALGDNITLYQGTWRDPASIEAAIEGCQSVLLIQMPSFGDDAEVQEAKLILKLAKAAGVQHVVFPTTMPLNNPNIREELEGSTVAPAVLNKGDVEDVIRVSGLTWTFLRPGFFLTNLLPPIVHAFYPEFKDRRFVNSYGPDCVLPLVDPDDIGAFIAAAFEDPAKFGEKIVSIAGELVRVDDMLRLLAKASGKPIDVVYRTAEETEKNKSNPFIAGHLVCIGLDKYVDMEEVKSWGVPLTSYAQFLEKHKEEIKA